MVRHPHFSQAIFVKFPRPNILRGSDGIKLFPEAGELSLEMSRCGCAASATAR